MKITIWFWTYIIAFLDSTFFRIWESVPPFFSNIWKSKIFEVFKAVSTTFTLQKTTKDNFLGPRKQKSEEFQMKVWYRRSHLIRGIKNIWNFKCKCFFKLKELSAVKNLLYLNPKFIKNQLGDSHSIRCTFIYDAISWKIPSFAVEIEPFFD